MLEKLKRLHEVKGEIEILKREYDILRKALLDEGFPPTPINEEFEGYVQSSVRDGIANARKFFDALTPEEKECFPDMVKVTVKEAKEILGKRRFKELADEPTEFQAIKFRKIR